MSRWRERAWVAAGWLLVAVAALVWTALDRRPPEWDHANHLERMVHCAQDLAAGDVRALVERSSFYPPLATCAGALVYRLWPSDAAAGVVTMLGFLGLGMASMLALGRAVASGTVGVAGALLFGTAPFVVFSVLNFQLDLPLAAMVAATLAVLLTTDRFRSVGYSLLAGVVAGLGMLTKPTFALYVLPAALAAAPRGRRGGVNASLAVLVAGALSLPWYGPRLMGLPAQIGARGGRLAAEQGHPDPLSWTGLTFYPTWGVAQLGVVATLLLLVGLAVAARRRQWFLLAALIVPFAAILFVQNKNLRYSLPLLPVAAVVAALGLTAFAGRARASVAALAGVVAAAQVSAAAFGVPPPVTVPVVGVSWAFSQPPMRADWRHREILALITRDSGSRAAKVSVVPNDNFFSVSNFRYYAVRDALPLAFTRAWDEDPIGVEYMILKSGDQGPAWTVARPRRVIARLAEDAALAAAFPVIGEYPLPDGSLATVRARRVPPVEDLTPSALERL
ncbi:MAG: ArnT family glycosyltransferase, partial [Candidatus Rokuibacteriota bacterium]